MKNIGVFYLKSLGSFGGKIFYIFEQACFRNALIPQKLAYLIKLAVNDCDLIYCS